MLWIVNFLRGWVLVQVSGAYVERFLNLCAGNGIGFWRMKRAAPDVIYICVTVRDFKRLRAHARKAMCHVHIVSKHGLRFFTVRFRKRIALVLGLALFIAAAWVLTSFVWIIDVTGCDSVSTDEIMENLRQNGVYIGAYVPGIDVNELKNDMMIKMPKLSYVGINLSGSHVSVRVHERVEPPKLESKNDSLCNIVAKKGGIITSIVVQSGTQEVNVGDTVYEGQLLASSYMTGRTGTTVTQRAKAQVRARTWYNLTSVLPLQTNFKMYTGREKSRYTLVFGKRRIKLYGNSGISYAECDKIIKTTVLTLPGNIRLPIALETQRLCEYASQQGSIPPETALEYLSENLQDYPMLEEGAVVLERKYTAGFSGNVARVTMTAECEEYIGVEETIPKGE